jgi:hypothetical protein
MLNPNIIKMNLIHKDFYIKKGIATLEYWRNPTKGEIKFGYGALHYRDFPIDECFDKDGLLHLKFRAKNDGLLYYYVGLESYTTKKTYAKGELKAFMPDW